MLGAVEKQAWDLRTNRDEVQLESLPGGSQHTFLHSLSPEPNVAVPQVEMTLGSTADSQFALSSADQVHHGIQENSQARSIRIPPRPGGMSKEDYTLYVMSRIMGDLNGA